MSENSDIDDELDAICAIYCNEGEVTIDRSVLNGKSGPVTVRMRISSEESTDCATNKPADLLLTLVLSANYPQELPSVSISTNGITKKKCEKLKIDLIAFASHLKDQPMLMELRNWVSDNWKVYRNVSEVGGVCAAVQETCWILLHLDHMRSKAKYTKTIMKWTKELSLCGRLVFCDKLILILLQGSEQDIKEYISRQKTVNVDVDSKGRSCKERMLRQISSIESLDPSMQQFNSFELLELASRTPLKEQFKMFGLERIFNEHIQNM